MSVDFNTKTQGVVLLRTEAAQLLPLLERQQDAVIAWGARYPSQNEQMRYKAYHAYGRAMPKRIADNSNARNVVQNRIDAMTYNPEKVMGMENLDLNAAAIAQIRTFLGMGSSNISSKVLLSKKSIFVKYLYSPAIVYSN